MDLYGNDACFAFDAFERQVVVRFLFFRFFRLVAVGRDDVQLDARLVVKCRVRNLGAAGGELLIFGERGAAKLWVEQRREKPIQDRNETGVAAKTVRQQKQPAFFGTIAKRVDQIAEQPRRGLAKTVDALLDVTDHETVGAAGSVARHQPQQLDLHRRSVLVFVDQNVLEPLLQTAGNRRRFAPLVGDGRTEQIQCHAQHVAEFRYAAKILLTP